MGFPNWAPRAVNGPDEGRVRRNNYEERWRATPAHLITSMPQLSPDVAAWVNSVRELTQPRAVHWCDGSDAEVRELTSRLVRDGELQILNPDVFPGCHLSRSDP